MEWLPVKALVDEYGLAVVGLLMFFFFAMMVYRDGKAERAADRTAYAKILEAYHLAMTDNTKALIHQTVLFDERTRTFEDLAEALRVLAGNVRDLTSKVEGLARSRGR